MSIFEQYAALKAAYPEDVARIEAEEEQTKALLEFQEYAEHPATQRLIVVCRRQVIDARTKLATDRTLSEEARRALWWIVDARLWFLELVAKDYQAELERIEKDLAVQLSKV